MLPVLRVNFQSPVVCPVGGMDLIVCRPLLRFVVCMLSMEGYCSVTMDRSCLMLLFNGGASPYNGL